MSYKLRIILEYFQPKIGRRIRIFSLGRKNNILIKKKKSVLSNELMKRDFCQKEQSWLCKDGVLGKLLFIFKTYYKARQCVITIHDSSAYYNLRQRVITICDSLVITILDNCYYNVRQILQFTALLQFDSGT